LRGSDEVVAGDARGTDTAAIRQRQAGLRPALAARHTLIVFNMEDYGVRMYL